MNTPQVIHILGASGAGTSTLGQVFERDYGFKWLDTDGFFWQQDDPPFTNILPREERVKLLATAIDEHPKCVISGSLCGWGDVFIPNFNLVIYVDTPVDIRIERLKKRELERFGDRIRDGGDMFENHRDFLEWAAKYDGGGLDMRSRALHEDWLKGCPCPVVRVDGTADCGKAAAEIIERFYTKPNEPWRVSVFPLGELEKYRFTVIFARHNGKWLYARHKERDTFETAGGHIEPGETPLDCAKRELFEETGAEKYEITPAFDYSVHRDTEFSYGQVYIAQIQELGDMPGFEMAEVKLFDTIPDKMRFPKILPVLFEKVKDLA